MNVEQNNEPVNEPVAEPDLMSRVNAAVSSSTTLPSDGEAQGNEPKDFIERIKSATSVEAAIQAALDANKSWESGYGKKFQKLSEKEKEMQQQMQEASRITPEKLKSLLNEPEFVKAVGEVLAEEGLAENGDTQWDSMDPEAKKAIFEVQKKTRMLEDQLQARTLQETHQGLKTKYADYDPNQINSFLQEIQTGKRRVGMEEVYKIQAFDSFEKKIEAAFKLGQEEGNKKLSTKFNMSSLPSTPSSASNVPAPQNPGASRSEQYENTANNIVMKALNKLRGVNNG